MATGQKTHQRLAYLQVLADDDLIYLLSNGMKFCEHEGFRNKKENALRLYVNLPLVAGLVRKERQKTACGSVLLFTLERIPARERAAATAIECWVAPMCISTYDLP